MMQQSAIVVLGLLAAAWLSVKTGKLDRAGGLTGFGIGWALYLGTGLTGLVMLGVFFGLGTGATAWRRDFKQAKGLAEPRQGRRTAGQVLANGGVAGGLGGLAWLFPAYTELLTFMAAASLASATSDTFSSELGNVYGRRFFNILTFRPDTRGLDGVVSLEGTLLGMLGSGLLAGIYALGAGWSERVVWVGIAGVLGNLADSVLGATLERRQYLSNDAVNFLNTLLGALFALGMERAFC